jgi:hypothetical protein
MVGERGFEPPIPWSRTRFKHLLKSIEILGATCIALLTDHEVDSPTVFHFMLQEPRLTLNSAAITGKRTIGSDDTMTRNNHANCV